MAEPGSADERTALAWQRTALALIATSAIVTRVVFDRLGALALFSVAIAVPAGISIFTHGPGRFRREAAPRPRRHGRGGWAPLVLAASTVVVGATELLAIFAA